MLVLLLLALVAGSFAVPWAVDLESHGLDLAFAAKMVFAFVYSLPAYVLHALRTGDMHGSTYDFERAPMVSVLIDSGILVAGAWIWARNRRYRRTKNT